MVNNKTALTFIDEFITNNNLRKMKKWSIRFKENTTSKITSQYISKLNKKIRNLLNLISDDDIIEMLKSFIFLLFACKQKQTINNKF